MTLIKIGGLTTLADARAAVGAGADLLGFAFSRAALRPEQAAEIVAALRQTLGSATPALVGEFVDESVATVRAIMSQVGLDAAQLGGSEPPLEVRQLAPHAYKVIRPQTRADAEAMLATYAAALPDEPTLPQLLVEAYRPWTMGASAHPLPLGVAASLAARYRILLGGLTPDTLDDAIAAVRPWGIDVTTDISSQMSDVR